MNSNLDSLHIVTHMEGMVMGRGREGENDKHFSSPPFSSPSCLFLSFPLFDKYFRVFCLLVNPFIPSSTSSVGIISFIGHTTKLPYVVISTDSLSLSLSLSLCPPALLHSKTSLAIYQRRSLCARGEKGEEEGEEEGEGRRGSALAGDKKVGPLSLLVP